MDGKGMTGPQFSLLATLVLFVRKGIITEKEMFDYYEELTEVYKDVHNKGKTHNQIIKELLEVKDDNV
jgi:hypothetical protein